jgi:fatty acid/phospholipid biosynthesis enzyme
MLKNGQLDGFCSAGDTGAMLVGASYTVNVIPRFSGCTGNAAMCRRNDCAYPMS